MRHHFSQLLCPGLLIAFLLPSPGCNDSNETSTSAQRQSDRDSVVQRKQEKADEVDNVHDRVTKPSVVQLEPKKERNEAGDSNDNLSEPLAASKPPLHVENDRILNESQSQEVSIRPFGQEGYLLNKDWKCFAKEVHTFIESSDARFKRVNGLADRNLVSFESFTYPGHYIRHQNGRLLFTRCATQLDKRDATFRIVEGLAVARGLLPKGNGWVSFELENHPGHFISRRGEELWTGGKEDDDTYARRATFRIVDSVPFQGVNTPAGRTLVHSAPQSAAIWRYTSQRPTESWAQPDFDDSDWREGLGGFGTHGPPQAIVRTVWDSTDIWLRRQVMLQDPDVRNLVFWCHHDDDVEIYVNGVLGARAKGYRTAYDYLAMSEDARRSLRPGKNTLAVHCKQDFGGQYIDVGIVEYPYFDLPMTGFETDPKLKVIAEEVRKLMEKHFVPCGTFAIMKGDRIVIAYGIGYLDQQKTKPIPANALMRTASVDKPITRAAIRVLANQKRKLPDGSTFSLETSLLQLFRSYGLQPPKGKTVDPRMSKVRIQHLMDMQSGLPDGAPAFYDLGLKKTLIPDDANRWMLGQPLRYDPGKPPKPEYSNADYSTLRFVVNKVSGDHVAFIRDHVLQPAGSTDLGPSRALPEDRHPREPWYYSPNFARQMNDPFPIRLTHSPYAQIDDNGFIMSSIALARFLRHYHVPTGVPLVDPRTGQWSAPDRGYWIQGGSTEGVSTAAQQWLVEELSMAAMFNRRGPGDVEIVNKLADLAFKLVGE